MHLAVRRIAAIVAAPALSLGVLAATSTPASAAPDPDAAAAAAAWLVAQPEDGLVTYDSGFGMYTDVGLSMDVGSALQSLGGADAVVDEISAAIAASVESGAYAAPYDYYFPAQPDPAAVRYQGDSASGTAKALAFLRGSNGDTAVIDDLAANLADYTIDSGAAEGRITDSPTMDGVPAPDSDYANLLGQAFAVQALAEVDLVPNPTSDYLVGLQCADGSFKESLPAVASATQDCAASSGTSSIDATALAVLSLLPLAADDDVEEVVLDAAAWLKSQQRTNGSFTTGDDFGANANSTGLATQALGLVVDEIPSQESAFAATVTKGAVWVRSHQVRVQACAPVDAEDAGAVAYADADRAAGLKNGITTATYGSWLRATPQAAVALTWAPAGGDAKVTSPTGFVKGGATAKIAVTMADPGEQVCAQVGTKPTVGWADVKGAASLRVTAPKQSATTKVVVYDSADASIGTATIKTLGAKKVSFTLKARVRLAKTQTVKVSGLAKAESVTITFRGKKVASGKATSAGAFAKSFKVTGKTGKAKVVVTGQFGNRTNTKTFTVTR